MTDITNLHRSRLDNGLEILLYPSFDAPVASFWVWYRVGSRNELPGITGVSHWVEHMMFKGTPTIGLGEVMLRVNQNGGELNAFTSYDSTAYHETLPADRIGLAVEIEADRMTNLLIDPGETESERTVILSERQMVMNNPSFVLWDETIGTAFRSHSYRHFVIGTEHDLKTMTRDDLYGYYRRFYAPNNAVAIATGAFDVDVMLNVIERNFGQIPSADLGGPGVVPEPAQCGERRVTLRRPAPAPEVLIGYHVPAAGHPDADALELLSAVLAGAGGRMGRSARLPRSLVSTGKARAAQADYMRGLDPFMFLVGATGLPDGDVGMLEALLLEQVDLISSGDLGETELARAKKQLTTAFHYSAESVTSQGHRIGEAAMQGDAADFFSYPDRIAKVSASDVQRVAREYLSEANRTIGHLIPTADSSGGQAVPGAAALRFGIGGPGAPRLEPFEREVIERGMTVLAQPQPADPMVAAKIRIDTGSIDDPADRYGLAHVTAQMLLRGSSARTREQFEDACDELGASIGIGSGREHTEINITCLAADLDACLALAGEALQHPVFDEQQLELTRREALAEIKQAEDNTMSVADQAVRELIFPDGHPRRHRSVGTFDGLGAITRDDLSAFHSAHLAKAHMTAAVVGGFRSTRELADQLRGSLGPASRAEREESAHDAPIPDKSNRVAVTVPGKEQADVALAFPVLGVGSPGYYDIEVIDTVLGRYGMMGRIGDSVRQKQGLAYYAFSSISPGRSQSLWFSRAGVDPANVDRAIESILAVTRDALDTGITPEELEGTRQLLTGQMALAMQTNAGIAGLLQTIEEFDLGLDYVERYPGLLAAVSADSARTALRDSLDIDRVQIAVAGPA